MSEDSTLPFSQREGIEPDPPQLTLGEVSKEFRLIVDYAIAKEVDRGKSWGGRGAYFEKDFKSVATDFHVFFLGEPISSFENIPNQFRDIVEMLVNGLSFYRLFDLVEFWATHPNCSSLLKSDLAEAFIKTRSAYRLIDGQVVAIGSEQQAEAFERAIKDSEDVNALGAKSHLVQAGNELRSGNWSGCVRESIHAVESQAKRFAPGSKTLGEALNQLEKRAHIHGGLKAAFTKLYGYTNGEDGVRHALVFEEDAKVDEADALFMLGACASFVSYLIARETED